MCSGDLHQLPLPEAKQGVLPRCNGAYRTRTSHLLSCAGTLVDSVLLQLEALLLPPCQTEKMAPCPGQGTPGAGQGWGPGSTAAGCSAPPRLPPSLVTLTLLSRLSSGDACKQKIQ